MIPRPCGEADTCAPIEPGSDPGGVLAGEEPARIELAFHLRRCPAPQTPDPSGGCSHVGGGGDQPYLRQSTRDRSEGTIVSLDALSDRRWAGILKREVLGGH